MRLGVVHHYGWAVAVTASDDHDVVDRRRIELIEPGFTPAPVHYEATSLGDSELAALVADVRASILRATAASFDRLSADLAPDSISSMSIRNHPVDFPDDPAVLRQSPWEARADSVMYLQLLAIVAADRGWSVHRFDIKRVEARAAARLGDRADDVLRGPRARLGPPWNAEHRAALAATVLASSSGSGS